MSSLSPLRLGTRGSRLALWQSNWVKQQLESQSVRVEIKILKTTGDVVSGSLSKIGGQGVFTKRLQDALLDHEIDLAVHSLKDLPTDTHPDLMLAAVPPREDNRDVLVAPKHHSLEQLPPGATVGTGSIRRKAQLLFHRPDLSIQDIRGNVDTRLEKVATGELDAIVLARAGLLRLGWEDRIHQVFDVDFMYPAIGQGALGIETRRDDPAADVVAPLTHPPSMATVIAERALLRTLQGGCLAPIGAATNVTENTIQLSGVVLSADGKHRLLKHDSDHPENAETLGIRLGNTLLAAGADKLL